MNIDKMVNKIIDKPIVNEAQNKRNMAIVKRDWMLGPDKTSINPSDNKQYWSSLAKAWMVPEKEARRRFCANCEYYENTPEMMKKMESIPINSLDKDGGGRGYCHKFDFICHNLRTCQAWERKDFELED